MNLEKQKLSFVAREYSLVRFSKTIQSDCRRKSSFTMLLSVIGQETSVTSSTNQMKKKVELLVFSRDSVLVFLQVNSRFYWDTCGSPVIKCLCFFCLFFSSTTKWKNGAIVPSGNWALNTMTSNRDPMRYSHADHACYLDDG